MLKRGDKLTHNERAKVLAAFGYRWTKENAARARAWFKGAGVPTMPLQDDSTWLAEHAFYVTKAGNLDSRYRHCEPHYMAGA